MTREFMKVYGIRGVVCSWIMETVPACLAHYRNRAGMMAERRWYKLLWRIALSKPTRRRTCLKP